METLRNYNVFCLDDSKSDDEVFQDLDPLFLIDSQELNLRNVIACAYGCKPDDVDNKVVEGEKDKAADSIHFQQLRAYELAKTLSTILPVNAKVCIVGAGVAGLTFALTLLKLHITAQTDIYELHRNPLPRKYKAHSRQIYPYHHSRMPTSELQADLQYICPVDSKNVERGGIPHIFSWNPGSVESIVDELQKIFSQARAYYPESRLTFKPRSRLTNIDPSQKKLKATFSVMDGKPISQEVAPQYDAIILALGGQRFQKNITGLPEKDYWIPVNFENLPPQHEPYRVLIIGAGNSAASEVFNFLFPEKNFAQLKKAIQDSVGVNDFESLNFSTLNMASFKTWCDKEDRLNKIKVAIADLKPYDSEELQIKILVRNKDDANRGQVQFSFDNSVMCNALITKDMNSINAFLIHCLWATGHLQIWSMPQKDDDNYVVETAAKGFVASFGKEQINLDGVHWNLILDCQPPERRYQDYFNISNAAKLWRHEDTINLRNQLILKQHTLNIGPKHYKVLTTEELRKELEPAA